METNAQDDAPFTPAGVLLFFTAIGCVFADAGILTFNLTHATTASAATGFADVRFMVPHVVLVAIAGAGFRRMAALIAIIGSPFAVFFSGMIALFAAFDGFAGPFVMSLFLHVVMLIAGLFELRAREIPFFVEHPRRRLWGVAVAVLVWGAATGMVVSRNVTEESRRQVVARDAALKAAETREFNRTGWMHRSNLRQLSVLARCIESYRGDTVGGPYPRSLGTVQRWAAASPSPDQACANLFAEGEPKGQPFDGHFDHQLVFYQPPAGRSDPWRAKGFSLELEAGWTDADEPVARNANGTRSYLVDTSGAIHVTAEHRRATIADAMVPNCGFRSPMDIDCTPYQPRNRWGVIAQLPTGGLGGPDSARFGDTTHIGLSFGGVMPPDSVRSVEIDWGERGSKTAETVAAAKSFPKRPFRAVDFNFQRVFQDTGVHSLRGAITTIDGSRYEYAHSLKIYRQIRLSGQTGIDNTGQLVKGGVIPQLRQTLENIRRGLARQGVAMDSIEYCMIDVADMGEWSNEAAAVFDSYFSHSSKGRGYGVQPSLDLPKGARVMLDCLMRRR